ncbi:Protein of unknown function [Evansella caseinilytica]|uniref:DUF3895 domain-containing protein n=1 Tax=Evansella caseinilytica TaxID=1503961 RepID=A0A1H3UM23_9BACI|nr:DUF3895 domain-containing protein [Evansella caseinilytica]SDZ63346.1 Protein of unknown function [Evansella caseinilytica]
MAIILEKEKRDEWLKKLPPEQRDFLQHHVKRGKKTVFANVLAMDKGIVIPPEADGEELEHLLDEWVLEDYIDNGFVNRDTPCECGRPLRYQYIVKHKTTKETRRFGMTHFEEHTGFPAEIVRKIKHGFQTIEYELDELLYKLHHGWDWQKELPLLPEGYAFPDDIQRHFDAKVPLLNRQLKRMKQQISSFLDDRRSLPRPQKAVAGQRDDAEAIAEQLETTLFNEDPLSFRGTVHPYPLAAEWQQAALSYINEGVTSARIVCELLIKNEQAPAARYASQCPKIYVPVCFFLDSLVRAGALTYTGSRNVADRYYKPHK